MQDSLDQDGMLVFVLRAALRQDTLRRTRFPWYSHIPREYALFIHRAYSSC